MPTKVQGSEAEDEWQEVDWVPLCTAELTVDDSFLLVLKPSSGGAVKAKPLGGIVRASPAEQGQDGRTLVVTTTDAMNPLYRLTFKDKDDSAEFLKLAEQAESSQGASTGAPDLAAGEAARAESQSKFEADICAALQASAFPPLVFGGAELCGPDPKNPSVTEVLLGTGAAVLLDAPEDGTVGKWQLLFYSEDEGAREPLSRFTIGPGTKLVRQKDAEDSGSDGPAATFQLIDRITSQVHTISFEDARVAALFQRDFRVRQRIMELSGKTVKGQKTAQELLGQVKDLKRQTVGARLLQLAGWIVFLIVLALGVRFGMHYKEDKGARKPAEYAKEVVADVRKIATLSRSVCVDLGSRVARLRLALRRRSTCRSASTQTAGARSSGSALRPSPAILRPSPVILGRIQGYAGGCTEPQLRGDPLRRSSEGASVEWAARPHAATRDAECSGVPLLWFSAHGGVQGSCGLIPASRE